MRTLYGYNQRKIADERAWLLSLVKTEEDKKKIRKLSDEEVEKLYDCLSNSACRKDYLDYVKKIQDAAAVVALGHFATQALRDSHFKDHGSDFGAKTPAEYEQQANSFLNGPKGQGVLEKVRLGSGDTVRYNPATEEFGVVRADGTIRTYFRPDPAVHHFATNLDYFNAQ
jgi:pyocin large subunit-like protein